ncbi:MAG: KUP/HAK/KT family potassium transporter, partial [Bacteroidia bacterium]|nr:KUP/HAK/KT family potassium transporter [Bacteroidia bacterium]
AWLTAPAVVGGAFLLADGIITPPISVSSAIEGLRVVYPDIPTVPIVIGILAALFLIQQMGTAGIGKSFGPIMLAWFTFIGATGLYSLLERPQMLWAVNPVYAYNLLVEYPGGFWLLGAVFLCTTGAEAVYSDMGHCGRGNIRVSWVYVKTCLLLSYAGQGAWILSQTRLDDRNPFYAIVPPGLTWFAIAIATVAAVIASQALISGSYTLVAEAIRLSLWPKVKIEYPTTVKGQLYLPAVNWLLLAGCVGVTLYFRESEHMEAAYGLAVTCTMLTTTLLVAVYMRTAMKAPQAVVALFLGVFLTIESVFLFSNALKIAHGGWVSVLVGASLMIVMYVWHKAGKIKSRINKNVDLHHYADVIKDLKNDETVPRFATNLVFLTSASGPLQVEEPVVRSILNRGPKRADVYWFLHVDVVDEPYTMRYKTYELIPGEAVWVRFKLGFRIEPRINVFFRMVVEDMVRSGEVNINSRYPSLKKYRTTGDFRFVVFERFLSHENDLGALDKITMNLYFFLKQFSIPDTKSFGLDTSNVTVERVPFVIRPVRDLRFERE